MSRLRNCFAARRPASVLMLSGVCSTAGLDATRTSLTLRRTRTGTNGRTVALTQPRQRRGRSTRGLGRDGRCRYCEAGGFMSRVADRTGADMSARSVMGIAEDLAIGEEGIV